MIQENNSQLVVDIYYTKQLQTGRPFNIKEVKQCSENPDIKVAFDLVQGLRNIFNQSIQYGIAYTKLAHWYKDVENTGFRTFNTVVNTIT